jgi:outer membrane protein TolC
MALADPMFGYACGRARSDRARSTTRRTSSSRRRSSSRENGGCAADGARFRRCRRADVAAERVRLAALASTLFDAYWLAERALETNAAHLALLEELRAAALARYAAGTSSKESVLAAETEHAMLLHGGILLAADRRIVSERINTLLHRAPALPLPPPPRALAAAPGHDLDAAELTRLALEQRPEIRARDARSARARPGSPRAARVPARLHAARRVRGLLAGDATAAVRRIELNLPLQLERRAPRSTRQRRAARSRACAASSKIACATGGRRARTLREAQHLLEPRTSACPVGQRRVSSARAAFETGQASFLELVDEVRALRAAELGEHEAQASLSRRHAELARALGEVPSFEEISQ